MPVLPALLFVHVLASPARAERAHAALTLDHSPGLLAAHCPEEKVLHDEIGRRIGYDPFASESPARLTVTIEGSKQAYRVTGKIRDADRETFSDSFVDADCTAAVTMMARALAAELTTIPAVERAPTPVPVPDSPLATVPPPVAPAPAPVPERAHLRAAAGVAVAFNLSPAVLTGPVVSAGARYSFVSVALEGRALFGPTADAGGVGVSSSYYAGSLSACGHYAALFGCGRVELGSLRLQPLDGVKRAPRFRRGGSRPSNRGRVVLRRARRPKRVRRSAGRLHEADRASIRRGLSDSVGLVAAVAGHGSRARGFVLMEGGA